MPEPVVIVSGLPRSGTSLMMRVLEGAGVPILQDHARPADESNPHGYFEHSAVRGTARDAGWLDSAAGRAVKVIHALLEHLPRDRAYRVILMRRPIAEIVASQDRMLARLGHDAGDLPGDRIGAILTGQLDAAIALLDREPCFTWIEVGYHRLLAQPGETIASVLAFVGVGVPSAGLARLVDPALHRERIVAGTVPGDDGG